VSNDDFNRSVGSSALGARLRRLSEQIDRDATRVYAARGVAFEQRWFGPLNQIVQNGPMAIGEIAEKLRITHVSVSQAARSLEAAGLVASCADAADGRRRLLALTSEGRARVRELAPIWAAFDTAATDLDDEAGGVVPILDRLDEALARMSLFDRISEMLNFQ
jgi:DNA-binding MarR family transcriptional regulator